MKVKIQAEDLLFMLECLAVASDRAVIKAEDKLIAVSINKEATKTVVFTAESNVNILEKGSVVVYIYDMMHFVKKLRGEVTLSCKNGTIEVKDDRMSYFTKPEQPINMVIPKAREVVSVRITGGKVRVFLSAIDVLTSLSCYTEALSLKVKDDGTFIVSSEGKVSFEFTEGVEVNTMEEAEDEDGVKETLEIMRDKELIESIKKAENSPVVGEFDKLLKEVNTPKGLSVKVYSGDLFLISLILRDYRVKELKIGFCKDLLVIEAKKGGMKSKFYLTPEEVEE